MMHGSEAGVRYLLGIGHSVDERDRNGKTVLMEAVGNSRIDMVRLLLDGGLSCVGLLNDFV